MLKYFYTDINYYSIMYYTSIPVNITSSLSSLETLQKEEMCDSETSVYKWNMKEYVYWLKTIQKKLITFKNYLIITYFLN